MAGPNDWWANDVKAATAASGNKEALEQAGKQASIASSQTSTEEGRARLPFIGGKAKADMTDAQLKLLRDLQANARDELKTFEGLDVVKTYEQGMRYFASALTAPVGTVGDQDLVTLAAKVQDPTGAVMQGDIERYNNVQVALERLPQAFRNEFNSNNGKFTPETRAKIIALMRNRVETYRAPYEETRRAFEERIGGFNEQIVPLGLKPIEPSKIIGPDPLQLYAPKIEAYDKKLRADEIRAQREAGGQSADIFRGTPPGTRIAGEDIQGWRFSPEAEADITSYYSDPKATAEGYAAMVADKAVAEGHVPPEQREDYFKRNLEASKDFFTLPPEERAKTKGVDYSAIDKAASENAGLVASVAQGVRNIPESTAQLAEGVVHTPQGIAAAAQLAAKIAQGEFDDPMVQAAKDMLEERYGSLDALQRTAIKDPVGIAGDLSLLLTGGGAAASRVPGMVRIGEAASAAGRAIDPLAGLVKLGTEGVPAAYTAAKARKPGMMEGIENIPSEIVGLPSGIGGQAVREAAGAGFERGMAGGPTARSEAFTEGMRRPGESAETIVDAARDAVAKLREQAGVAYRQAMQNFGQNPVPLDIDVVRQRMAKIKPRNYDAMVNAPKRPSDHIAWEQMNDTVNHYADQAMQDPSLLEPMAMDAFKQDLYDIGSKIGGAYDRDAARIAKTAYTAVRQELVKHDPVYADIMKNYEKAAVEARELEDMFSLGQARGKPVKVDTAARKLQSIMRNNANTNYGMRAKRGERLAELDETGTLMAANAGQMASAPTARGITRGVVAGGTVPGAGIAAALNPATLFASVPLMAATSPRLTGELAYGAGRLTGTGARVAKDISQSQLGQGVTTTAKAIADLYQKYPELGLAGAQLGSRAEETEVERLKRLYGIPTIAAGE